MKIFTVLLLVITVQVISLVLLAIFHGGYFVGELFVLLQTRLIEIFVVLLIIGKGKFDTMLPRKMSSTWFFRQNL